MPLLRILQVLVDDQQRTVGVEGVHDKRLMQLYAVIIRNLHIHLEELLLFLGVAVLALVWALTGIQIGLHVYAITQIGDIQILLCQLVGEDDAGVHFLDVGNREATRIVQFQIVAHDFEHVLNTGGVEDEAVLLVANRHL